MATADVPKPLRPKEAMHDEAPSDIVDHAFESRGEWWDLCKHCHLAESAHRETTRNKIRYYSDDMPEIFEE